MVDQAPTNIPRQNSPVDSTVLFEVLVREHTDSLLAFLRASVSDQTAVDDLFQDVMLIAWQKIGDYDRTRPFGAWLRGIARNLVLAHYRAQARMIAFSNDRMLDFLDQRLTELDHQPGDTFDEKIAALTDCLNHLPPLHREPIDMHYRDQRTSEWIAQHLSTSKEAIQKRLQRARSLLAECLENKGVLVRLERAT